MSVESWSAALAQEHVGAEAERRLLDAAAHLEPVPNVLPNCAVNRSASWISWWRVYRVGAERVAELVIGIRRRAAPFSSSTR